jgi:hypothetical protein
MRKISNVTDPSSNIEDPKNIIRNTTVAEITDKKLNAQRP